MRLQPVLLGAFVCSTAVFVGFPLGAQEIDASGIRATEAGSAIVARTSAPEWGTAALGVRTVHALGCQQSDSFTTFTSDPITTHRFRNGPGFGAFVCALPDLPAGALITGLELQGCDTNATDSTDVSLYRLTNVNTAGFIGSITTGIPETPGCGFFGGDTNLPGTHAVDSYNNAYFIHVALGAPDNTTTFGAVRVFYRLQVSPAPGTATFPVDVPTTHPFFRFIEALAASGITAGCAPGSYCPNSPITRGEMAVFLAAALGLHFPY